MKNRVMSTAAIIVAVFIAVVSSACGINDEYATPTSDSKLCVYDGSERGGQKLKFQLEPNGKSRKIDDNDQVVKIPASNRFYATTRNANRRDPLASEFYGGNARGAEGTGTVRVEIEGQLRFRFNLSKACQWYSKHGRRNADSNGDLGFNARGADAENAGWFKFLTENFGQTMDGAVDSPVTLGYIWKNLVYNYPVNADAEGKVPDGKVPGAAARTDYGNKVAQEFTDRLNRNLGGEYFCGIQDDPKDDCPPIIFEVTNVTGPADLMALQAQTEKDRADLQHQQDAAKLREQQLDASLRAEKAQQAILREQINTAELQALKDSAFCRAITSVNPALDCKGALAPVIVGK